MEGNVYDRYYKRINQEIGMTLDRLPHNFRLDLNSYFKVPFEGESTGYTVKTLEKDFPISNYPLEQTEFLYDSKQGMVIKIPRMSEDCDEIVPILVQNRRKFWDYKMGRSGSRFRIEYPNWLDHLKARDQFVDEKNTQFDYSMFHYREGFQVTIRYLQKIT